MSKSPYFVQPSQQAVAYGARGGYMRLSAPVGFVSPASSGQGSGAAAQPVMVQRKAA